MLHPVSRGLAAAALAAAASAGLAAPAGAATAHNSQAGSWGPTKHTCAPTPYFPAGGCASAAIQDDRRYPFTVGPYEDQPGRRLERPGLPLDPFDD